MKNKHNRAAHANHTQNSDKDSSTQSVGYLKYFILIVIILSIVSLAIKFIVLMVNSSFTTHSANILVLTSDAHLVHIDKSSQELSIFTVKNGRDVFMKDGKLDAGLKLMLPVDAIVVYKPDSFENFPSDFFTTKTVARSLFGAISADYQDFNAADILKIYLAHRGVHEDSKIHVTRGKEYLTDFRLRLPEIYDTNFRDETIFNEKKSIEVVNATDVAGFGTKVARLLENAGYNIIAIRNGTNTESVIINRDPLESNTTLYLKRFFEFKSSRDKNEPVADISVILGPDSVATESSDIIDE